MKEKSSKGLLIWLIIFIIISLAMGGYIAYDKFLNKKENVTSVSSKDEQKSSTKEEVQETYHSLAIKDNKCIDSECNSDYSVVNYFDLGSITIEDNIAKIRLTKDKVKNYFGDNINVDSIKEDETYDIKFDQAIQETYVMNLGQDAWSECIFFLMEDGTVEYAQLFATLKSISNNTEIVHKKVDGVKDIVRMVSISAQPKGALVGGYGTALAQKANGDYYDVYNKIADSFEY